MNENDCYVIKLTKEQLELLYKSSLAYRNIIATVISYEELNYYNKLNDGVFSQLPEDWMDD